MLVRIRLSKPQSAKPTPNHHASGSVAVAAPDQITRPVQRLASGFGHSTRVALGILGSRVTGLLRERVIGHYFGLNSITADAFRVAIRIPNLLNNLFGEGVLSASFVTVYAKLRALKEHEEADDLASAVFSLLALICALLVGLGILATPFLVYLLAPGFEEESRELTIRLVRILFPCTGLLVMSAWCLGVLNSHRRFLLSYLSPVALNVAVIVITIWAGQSQNEFKLVVIVAWAFVLGAGLQFGVQFPAVRQLLPEFQPLFDFKSEHLRQVIANFGPVFVSRGVVQLSAFVDSIIASLLPVGAVAAFGYAQVISILPVSLFSMSVSAAELPALSSAVGSKEEVALMLRKRLSAGLRRIAFFIVPSAVAFLLLGDVVAAALYQSGRFNHDNAVYVWGVLAGSSIGLLATSLGRLYSSAFYALLDTKTPLKFAVIRVVLTSLLGLVSALMIPKWIGVNPKWGVAGLTASAGVAGWLEFALLRRSLTNRIGNVSLDPGFTGKLWGIALVSGMVAYLPKLVVGVHHPILLAMIVIPIYGTAYFAATYSLNISEAEIVLQPVLSRLPLRRRSGDQ